MRNKWILTFIIAILALPFLSTSVLAEENVVYEDGVYPITAKAINADTGETSGAAGFINKEATLHINDGEATFIITVPHDEMAEITGLQVEGNQPEVTEDETAKYMAYKLANVKSELNAKVQYEVPALDMKHDVGFTFVLEGLDEIPLVQEEPTEPEEKPTVPEESVEPKEPSEPAEPTTPIEPEEPELPGEIDEEENSSDEIEKPNPALVPDEAYNINFVSKSNSVNRQFNNPAALLYKNGVKYIQLTGTGGQFIESLTINGTEVTWSEKNADGTFTIQFKVDGPLSDVLDFGMVINTGRNIMEHLVDLSFDESTQKAADINHYTLLPVSNDSEEENNGEEPADDKSPIEGEEPSESKDPVTGEEPVDKVEDNNKPGNQDNPADKDKNKPQTPTKKDQLVPDKAYEIDFEIKHETEDNTSAADSFFKDAILLEKDGKWYLQITVNGKQYIDSLKNNNGEMFVVKEDGDTIVYQFKLAGRISDVILLDMIITVPGIYENQKHKARLFLDESSMREIDASAYRLVAADNGDEPIVDEETVDENQTPNPNHITDNDKNKPENGDDKKTPDKPEFGSTDKNEQVNQTKTGGNETNPKTGDTTNILLYVLLLIGSAIPLAIKFKRRFV